MVLRECEKKLSLEINTVAKYLLFRMEYIFGGGRLFDDIYIYIYIYIYNTYIYLLYI